MSIFTVNTGCRDSEICNLQWQWEVKVPALDTSVFIFPGRYVKNRDDRQDLLGHRSGRITTHYSAAELSRLIDAVNSVCIRGKGKPEFVVLRRLSVS